MKTVTLGRTQDTNGNSRQWIEAVALPVDGKANTYFSALRPYNNPTNNSRLQGILRSQGWRIAPGDVIYRRSPFRWVPTNIATATAYKQTFEYYINGYGEGFSLDTIVPPGDFIDETDERAKRLIERTIKEDSDSAHPRDITTLLRFLFSIEYLHIKLPQGLYPR